MNFFLASCFCKQTVLIQKQYLSRNFPYFLESKLYSIFKVLICWKYCLFTTIKLWIYFDVCFQENKDSCGTNIFDRWVKLMPKNCKNCLILFYQNCLLAKKTVCIIFCIKKYCFLNIYIWANHVPSTVIHSWPQRESNFSKISKQLVKIILGILGPH